MAPFPVGRKQIVLFAFFSGLLSALWIWPNATKPFHIDDPLFIYWARTIAPLPGESPMEYVNWEHFREPLTDQVRTKGPGWSLLLAQTRRWWGDNEALSHWLQWPFATMFLVGAAILASHFGVSPWPVFLLCASSPLFLLPTASAMSDIACLGLGILGFALWLSVSSVSGLIAAGLLIALAGQMKPAIFPLLPLLFCNPSGRLIRARTPLLVAIVACFLAGFYPRLPPLTDIGGSILDRTLFLLSWSWQRGGFWLPKTGYTLATFSALVFFPAAYAVSALMKRDQAPPYARMKAFGFAALTLMVTSAAGFWKGFEFPGGSFANVTTGLNPAWFNLSIVCFIAWGLIMRSRGVTGPIRWLFAWLLLVFAGSVIGTPNPAARSMTFAVPALAILLTLDMHRQMSRRARLIAFTIVIAGNLWLSFSLARNDYIFASFCKASALRGHSIAVSRHLPLWTTGQWGLRFYVEENGGTALGQRDEPLKDGALLLNPELTDRRPLPPHLDRRTRSRIMWDGPAPSPWGLLFTPWRTVPPKNTSASFHGGHVWLPYAFASGPIERIEAIEITPLQTSNKRRSEQDDKNLPATGRY